MNSLGLTLSQSLIKLEQSHPQRITSYYIPFQHDRTGMTYAMKYIKIYKKIPPQKDYYIHDPNIQDKRGRTVAYYLVNESYKEINIPSRWYHDPYIVDDAYLQSIAMLMAQNGQIPGEVWKHDPTLRDIRLQTVAMLMAQNMKQIPVFWEHDPNLQDFSGFTVEMYYAEQNIIPPKKWLADKNIRNEKGQTANDLIDYNKKIIYL